MTTLLHTYTPIASLSHKTFTLELCLQFTLTHYYNHQNPLISNSSHNIIFPNNRMDYFLIGHPISRMNKLRYNILY